MNTEKFWANDFGNTYHGRQGEKGSVRSNEHLFSKILGLVSVRTVLEFGAGTGLNLKAINNITWDVVTSGVELNEAAAKLIEADVVHQMNMFDYDPSQHGYSELVFTKGLLIHIDPNQLEEAYTKIYDTSVRYILIAEYYNPTPLMVSYRGNSDKLWKRDFAGDMMAIYPDLKLLDYGFVYHGDEYPQDDITWFLMEKG